MARLYFHHFATLLLLASSILLLVTCITAPTVNDLSLLTVRSEGRLGNGNVALGIWGACWNREGAADICSRARIRYRPSVFISNALSSNGEIRISRTVDGITGGLLLAPVLCGCLFFCFLLALCSYAAGFFLAAFFVFWNFLGLIVLVIIQATVFGVLRDKCRDIPGVAADYGAAFWCTISALPVLLTALSCCLAAAFSDRHREKGWF